MTGLGGGVVVTPALTLLMGVDLRYAIGASLVSVIATSSGAAAAYVREGYSNIRIGNVSGGRRTTLGALLGAFLATRIPTAALAVIFGLVLLHAAWQSTREPRDNVGSESDPLATKLKMNGDYPTPEGRKSYYPRAVEDRIRDDVPERARFPELLGIGSGALKVLAMDRAMRIPFKVSTTTSNFMIGVTAAASAGIYLSRGYIDPALAMPVMLGVLAGSLIGARILIVAQTRTLRWVFAVVVGVLAVEMIYSGVSHKL